MVVKVTYILYVQVLSYTSLSSIILFLLQEFFIYFIYASKEKDALYFYKHAAVFYVVSRVHLVCIINFVNSDYIY